MDNVYRCKRDRIGIVGQLVRKILFQRLEWRNPRLQLIAVETAKPGTVLGEFQDNAILDSAAAPASRIDAGRRAATCRL